MAVVRDLGTPVKRHETDIRRRRRIFLVAVPLGVLAACLGILMVAALGGPAVTGGATVIPGVVLGTATIRGPETADRRSRRRVSPCQALAAARQRARMLSSSVLPRQTAPSGTTCGSQVA